MDDPQAIITSNLNDHHKLFTAILASNCCSQGVLLNTQIFIFLKLINFPCSPTTITRIGSGLFDNHQAPHVLALCFPASLSAALLSPS